MVSFKNITLQIITFTLYATCLSGYSLELNTFNGNYSIELGEDDDINEIRQFLSRIPSKNTSRLNRQEGKKNDDDHAGLGSTKNIDRDYSVGYSKENFNDISFIVKTLSYKSLTQIWKSKGSLETAGDRLKSVHPLNFLLCIFENEELKVGIRNIRKRGWVWSDFFSGLKNSLKEEFLKGNIDDYMVIDFAEKLEIDPAKIYPFIISQDWVEFADTLIEIVPRKGNTDLYGF